MNTNPMTLFLMMQNSKNPQQFITNLISQQGGNPFFTNLLSLAQSGNQKEIESIARNAFKEQGRDFDKEFSYFKQMIGM